MNQQQTAQTFKERLRVLLTPETFAWVQKSGIFDEFKPEHYESIIRLLCAGYSPEEAAKIERVSIKLTHPVYTPKLGEALLRFCEGGGRFVPVKTAWKELKKLQQ